MKQTTKLAAAAAIALTGALPMTAQAQDSWGHHGPGDIVTVAAEAGSFETLLTVARAAGLVGTLQGEGPFTVFAPTDEAFAALPEGTLEALLQDTEKLAAILTYHVVPGRVMAADVVKLDSAKTLNGRSVGIDASNGVRIDNATVIKADVVASNGVIHVIDTVLIPE